MIPIGTDIRTRKLPAANVTIILANVAVYLLTDVFGGPMGQALKHNNMLDATRPVLYQYLTYQFLHGDLLHLGGNMLFLWVFGNAVCDKMGNTCYTLFYLAGGVFSGIVFAMVDSNPIIGASGAIAAVTTAFLALFPRSRVQILLLWVIITTFEMPSTWLILFKIILYDNVLAPRLTHGLEAQSVAHSAHLGGYIFGFAAALLMLAVRALPRNQFDVLGIWGRFRRRAGFAAGGSQPYAARPATEEMIASRQAAAVVDSAAEQLREEIFACLEQHDRDAAARLYQRLAETSERPLLSRQAQIEVANHLASLGSHVAAANAYELFLSAYPSSPDADQVRLLLGLIYNRHLGRHEDAARHLRAALNGLAAESQRGLALDELRLAEERTYGRPAP